MPFVDIQSWLGINVDGWMLQQSGAQPHHRAPRCHAFEKEWIECGHGIGQIRAKKECLPEFEDFYECMHKQKTQQEVPLLHPDGPMSPLATSHSAEQEVLSEDDGQRPTTRGCTPSVSSGTSW
ncbi:NADH dehydrogenase [ubiquinone] iron-sulfur protein 5 isoform X1 [Pseudoliparis swirei]|uniref:NADH dehydrogenase [ubiquinone] iron-sulfur protein 5 isoform X1 n=1 Tax=Pseudoliparis swirei TaxID=2059687 RepID=UPI0024BD9DA7|nr:NADH dehydrogenase [ubiquinone] iron-sulfur protein 5 isoform X1 [Pseudoliparis swirei]